MGSSVCSQGMSRKVGVGRFTCALLLVACGAQPSTAGTTTGSPNSTTSAPTNPTAGGTTSHAMSTSSGTSSDLDGSSSDDSASDDSATDRAGASGDESSATTDGASDTQGDGTATSTDSESEGETTNGAWGRIQVGRQLDGPGVEADAEFQLAGAVTDSDCVQQTFGDCLVTTCTKNDNTPTPPAYAGNITIKDGAMIDLLLTTTPGQPYPHTFTSDVALAGGEQVMVVAQGGDVPTFAMPIHVPLAIVVTAPALDDFGSASVPPSGDLVLTFDNRAADGETQTNLYIIGGDSYGMGSLACVLPTETGTATIPAAALDPLRGSGSILWALTTRGLEVQAAAFKVKIFAYMSAVNEAKSQPVHFQL